MANTPGIPKGSLPKPIPKSGDIAKPGTFLS